MIFSVRGLKECLFHRLGEVVGGRAGGLELLVALVQILVGAAWTIALSTKDTAKNVRDIPLTEGCNGLGNAG